jgi:hypothetical protein
LIGWRNGSRGKSEFRRQIPVDDLLDETGLPRAVAVIEYERREIDR